MMRMISADESWGFSGLVGLRFTPKDEELLHFLRCKVNGEALYVDEGLIPEKAVYEVEPWLLGHAPRHDLKKNEWYCFAKLEKASGGAGEGRRVRRSVVGKEGGGWWQGNTGDSAIMAGRGGAVLGFTKTFTFFKNKKVEIKVGEKRKRCRKEEGDKTDWIMHEYRLSSNHAGFQDWVLCRIRYTGKNAMTAISIPVKPLEGSDNRIFHDQASNMPAAEVQEGGNAVPIAVDEAFPVEGDGGGSAVQMTESFPSDFIITINERDQAIYDMLFNAAAPIAADDQAAPAADSIPDGDEGGSAVPSAADDQASPAAELIPDVDSELISIPDEEFQWLFGGDDAPEFQEKLDGISALFSGDDELVDSDYDQT